ncbi:pab-dependent poly -specific ribonuclease subunit pan2 [Moesziomyces antarcticus]|uniref:Related to PAN2 - component of Pab1p-stimulated poly(A) ribonuclease n=2 Tax=Pseudozyma antarctica TaxID=84753 RepID=A0A5C3FVD1_PSEA2|nr:pab-dependent poly -specific ribonuclease subunit pan2 [Moesziomyces antarcticus]GAK66483.1 pab-dependent poly -specific ribonuclease subunit pan2 [Moesziomyces antarcticus]SPO47527.1 related to PAN2 - component of Pab1p-stimulated poly(A) ribonuclease [Moesziomyces antarcticus]
MAEWSEHAHYGNPTGPVGIPPAVTALSFDPYSELLWQGTSFGTVSSLYSSQLSRYTSYIAHGLPTHPSPTKGILADERHIFSVGDNGIKAAQRRGLAKWSTLTHDFGTDSMNLVSMCASPLAASSDLVAAGLSQSAASTGEIDNDNDLILTVNNSTGALLRSVPSEAPIVHVRKSGRYICAGTVTGHIQLRDPRTLKVEHRLHAHPGGLVDVQADGNILYSVGWTVRQGHPVPEPFIRVHDLRSMRALVPIPFAAPGGPSLLAIHPKLSSTIIVSAPQGQFQIVDIATPGEGRFFYTNASSFTTSLAVSPSADYIAFGEADGSVRLWSSSSDTSNLRFNTFNSSALDFPDMAEPTPFVNWSTETPLSSIGMPHYNDKLLSYFDHDDYVSEASPLFNPPSKIDPAVLNNLKTVDYLGYASLPPHLRGQRNVVTGKGPGGIRASALHRPEDRKKIGIPLFRSEKEKEQSKKAAAAAAAGVSAADKKKKKADKKRAEAGSDSLSASADSRVERKQASDTAPASSRATTTDSKMATRQTSPTAESGEPSKDAAAASDKEHDSDDDSDDSDASDEEQGQEDFETAEAMLAKGQMPSYYRLKTIQYSRFGVEDFDFDFYNKTPYSGLETHIQNSYANSYLQALHYLPPFREMAKAHILHDCARDNCLLCEAGFLFRMLEDARGANCQASNFLRAFGNSHKAASLGLMDREDSVTNVSGGSSAGKNEIVYSQLVQTLNRFVLDCTSAEAQSVASTAAAGGAAATGARGPPPGLGPPMSSNRGGTAGGRQATAEPASPTSGSQTDSVSAASSPVAKLFALNAQTKTACIHCGRESSRASAALSVDLVYPRRPMSNEAPAPADFASVLRASLVREMQSRAPCRACQFTAMFRTRRVMPPAAELPRVLSVNAAIQAPEHLHYWLNDSQGAPKPAPHARHGAMPHQPFGKQPFGRRAPNAGPEARSDGGGGQDEERRTYLPPRVAIGVQGDDVRVVPIYTPADLERAKPRLGSYAVYRLRSMVVQISADKEQPHLCALVRVPEAECGDAVTPRLANAGAAGVKKVRQKGQVGPWYLFNDFLVRNVPEAEALGFQNAWKMPSVLMWEREDMPALSVDELRQGRTSIDPTILCRDYNIALHRDPARIRHSVLAQDELPKPGTLVAIDAEFVALNQEELEIRSDGTRSVIRPTRLSLARVSVVRGQGPKEGEAFIDDHIHTHEDVVDYLTKFSGILPGDLDPSTSSHTVVPHKSAYKKLRLLVDCGCIFIGHGLKKDFRIINIFVPPSQVIDTVDLFHSPNHPRRLSLRFLSWFLLKIDIQSGYNANNQVAGRLSQASQQDSPAKSTVESVASSAAGAGSTAVEGGHDSIEDALAALKLFRMYEVFNSSHRLEDVLEDIYEAGRRLNWKPPNAV